MSRQHEDAATRRRQIFDAALSLFARRGLFQTTVEDIADEAGISKGLTYWYYQSKDALTIAILKHTFEQDVKTLEEALVGTKPAIERILDYTRASISDFEKQARSLQMIFEFYAMMGRQKKVREIIKGFFKQKQEILAKFIKEAASQGEFGNVDSVTTANTIIAVQEGLFLQWILDIDNSNWLTQAESSIRALLPSAPVSGKKRSSK